MCNAKELNQWYLETMLSAAESEKVLFRIREYWWDSYLQSFEENGANTTLDQLDISMGDGRESLNELAISHANDKGHDPGSSKYIQAVNQFLKSNTGKMFERFIGLSVAYALKEADSSYCILPFKNETIRKCHGASPSDFEITVALGEKSYVTKIDSDLFCFNPSDSGADIYLISIKSTLKDRFHNVPFWNLLRLGCINQVAPNMLATNREFLSKLKYVAICSDLAEEQPDFSNEDGPRNLISLDASLLDAAYVSASRARGLGSSTNHFGLGRDFPFSPLSKFYGMLTNEG